ncbi:FkbM family methyltransferase, partial [cf. Phormidesmis sp. LEGE 11477]|uniref:FkbM family methyltransferase n=1 Tax=cf. Phormidesmis sp. LEGE 11477 TaxID=1828680 RepID=UPI001882D244
IKGFASQRGQDYYVDKLLNGKKDGFFVDVGANHPTEISNTIYLERKGWNGLSFEPQKHLCKLFEEVRGTKVLPYVLGSEPCETEFGIVESDGWEHALSGVFDVMRKEGAAFQGKTIRREKRQVHRLVDVLLDEKIEYVDFMSIDVEGYELEVLKGMDFSKVHVEILIVENDRTQLGNVYLREFIKAQGFKYVARLSGDDVFRHLR